MTNKKFITAKEIAEEIGISESFGYKIIKQLNTELKNQGYITFSGKVSRQFFEEKIYYSPENEKMGG